MVECTWPETQLEPWHAIFKAEYGSNSSAYLSASRYGQALISMGLAENYRLHGLNNSGVMEYHCIPTEKDEKSTLDYWIGITT